MPASTSNENPRLFVSTVAELAGIETANLSSGDLAYVTTPTAPGTSHFFYLDKANTTNVDNLQYIATKDSALGPQPATPGRWLRSNILQS